MHEWESWSGEVVESHLSYPMLSYYRSQHDNQSWLAALTVIWLPSPLVLDNWQNSPRGRSAKRLVDAVPSKPA
jgi:hypothetical protein